MCFGYICTVPEIIIIHIHTKNIYKKFFLEDIYKVSVVTAEEMQ